MTEFGKCLILNGDIKYIGDGEDPTENPYMKSYARALKEVYQPERLNPEDAFLRKICEDNPAYYDPNGELPLVFDKNLKRLSHEEILSICDSPTTENK